MQASWGAENGAPGPTRGGKLYGEVGTWKMSMECSVPDVFTFADKEVRGGDDPDVKFNTKHWYGPEYVQSQSTKKPAEMDIDAANMFHSRHTFSAPGQMTMNDHDRGEVWPPPEGARRKDKFMSMVKEPYPRTAEVGGIMVGYKGHVPRARDKVGGCPLGGLPAARGENGFPLPEETAPTLLPGMGTQTSRQNYENPLYVSTSHAVQFHTAAASAGLTHHSPHKIKSSNLDHGFIPRYAGHKATAKEKGIGGSVYGADAPKTSY